MPCETEPIRLHILLVRLMQIGIDISDIKADGTPFSALIGTAAIFQPDVVSTSALVMTGPCTLSRWSDHDPPCFSVIHRKISQSSPPFRSTARSRAEPLFRKASHLVSSSSPFTNRLQVSELIALGRQVPYSFCIAAARSVASPASCPTPRLLASAAPPSCSTQSTTSFSFA